MAVFSGAFGCPRAPSLSAAPPPPVFQLAPSTLGFEASTDISRASALEFSALGLDARHLDVRASSSRVAFRSSPLVALRLLPSGRSRSSSPRLASRSALPRASALESLRPLPSFRLVDLRPRIFRSSAFAFEPPLTYRLRAPERPAFALFPVAFQPSASEQDVNHSHSPSDGKLLLTPTSVNDFLSTLFARLDTARASPFHIEICARQKGRKKFATLWKIVSEKLRNI